MGLNGDAATLDTKANANATGIAMLSSQIGGNTAEAMMNMDAIAAL